MISAIYGRKTMPAAQRLSSAAAPTEVISDTLLFAFRKPISPPITKSTM
jgi:hypothetical protein